MRNKDGRDSEFMRMLMICSSVNLVLRILSSPRRLYYGRTLIIPAPLFGEEVNLNSHLNLNYEGCVR